MLDRPSDTNGPGKPAEKKEPVVVKKYANRRLYNTETSTYVTLDDLAAMVRSERDFIVYDAKSGDELTHTVLTQIIVDQEGRMGSGQTMLPIPFLRQLIRFYGDSVGKMVPTYLQVSLDTLSREQAKFREQIANAFTPQGAIEAYHEQARKNLEMFEQAMRVFSPFTAAGLDKAQSAPGAAPKPITPAAPDNGPARLSVVKTNQTPASTPASTNDQLADMRAQLAGMQAMIDKLAKERESGS
jgi:polyhydroxyalkanoate synthesis repressor PhaR